MKNGTPVMIRMEKLSQKDPMVQFCTDAGILDHS